MTDIRSILKDLDQHELYLDPVTYRQLSRHATLIQEGLEDVQSNWDGTKVAFNEVTRTWGWNQRTRAYRLNIDPEEIIRLSRLGMEEGEIARTLGCSRPTLWARKKELGIGKQVYSDLSDEDLELVSLRSATQILSTLRRPTFNPQSTQYLADKPSILRGVYGSDQALREKLAS